MTTTSTRIKMATRKGLNTMLKKALLNGQPGMARMILEELKSRPVK